jgi:curved DNA-binding protein
MDYYSILGINKQASQDEIKKAYRKQAMANHPDRGGDSGKFAQINEAYETLKDPNKRQAYDNPQVRMNTQSFDVNDMNTIFEAMFGRGARPQQRRNQDIKIGIRISLADAATGKDVLATYKLRNGRESSASIRIHPGVNDMEVIRFQGLGDATHPQLPRGDLLVQIRVLSHARFERDGRNLRTNLDVDVFELMLGTTMIIDKLTGGPLRVKIPKGTNPGTVLSVAGHGMPDPKAGRTGNLYIHIKGILPKLNTIQEEKVKRLNDELNNGS